MAEPLRVACIQNRAVDDLDANLEEALRLAREAQAAGARFVLLPEHFSCMQPNDAALLAHAMEEAEHPALVAFRAFARELGVWCLLGSLAVKAPGGRFFNRSLLLDDRGRVAARYDKIHLFDVELREGEYYRESASVAPGGDAVLAATPWGPLGMSVCYDLRFPHLYQSLARAGARMLSVPAAFTRTTGRAHWHVLVRARAIETGCFVLAPAQCGVRPWGRATYGHSLVVDPWGTVLADGGDEPGLVLAELDLSKVEETRAMIPSLAHARAFEPPADVQTGFRQPAAGSSG